MHTRVVLLVVWHACACRAPGVTTLPREREKTVPACTVDLLAPPLGFPVPEVIDTQPLLDCVSLDLLVSVSIDAGTPVDLGDHFAAGRRRRR